MKKVIILICISVLLLTACQPQIPKDALLLSSESLAERQLQTRRFETDNNQAMLSAAVAVLQDLGFNLDESEAKLGILVGSKRRDATSGAQIAAGIFIALLGGSPPPMDKEQLIRVSMVAREITSSTTGEDKYFRQSTVRVTFQRIIINTANQVTRAEQITDPEIYEEFFDKLSKSVFLEAHAI